MSWPLSQDYNEAIQSPKSSFADPDLRRGEAACNALGLPMPYSGNFADVYQMRCPDGRSWAVKCFTREALGLRERYQEIAAHLRRTKLPFTVDFTYLEQGIRVAGKWFPALKMQWVEGLTLNQFLAQSLDKPAMLQALLQVWGRMAKHLRAAEVGHCDLQHGNVLMVPGASANSLALKLIDYDGMWVPGLAGTKSGEVGHPSYQHPRRLKEGTYNIEVDRFPLLLVATSLLALKAKGKELWDRYDNGDNLLFKEVDLREPLKSHLFLDLTKIDDPAIKPMVDHLVKALRGGLETTPLLEEVTPEARPAPTTSSRPSRLATTAGAKAVAASTSPLVAPVAPLAPVAPVVAGAIDFAELSPNSDRPKRKRTKANAAVHMAGWVGGGVALVFVVAAMVGLAVWAMSDSPNDTKQGPSPSPVKTTLTSFTPKPPTEEKFEGESLIPLNVSPNCPYQRQDMLVFPNDKWSENAQLWCRPKKAGEYIEFNLPVTAAGRYRVVVQLTKARDYGVVQLSLNGKPLGDPIDCFVANDVLNTGRLDLGVAELKKGDSVLRIEVTGTNEQSVDDRYNFGLDCVVLEPVDAGPPNPSTPPGEPAELTQEVFDKIDKDMTQDDVVKLLGPSVNNDDDTLVLGTVKIITLRWRNGGNQVEVVLTQDRVTNKGNEQGWPVVWPSGAGKNPPPSEKSNPLLTRENFDKIAKGMKEEDVVKLLGPPTFSMTTLDRWQQGDIVVDVWLVDGKVIAKVNLQDWPVAYPDDKVKAAPAPTDDDPIRAKLDRAKTDFDAAVKEYQQKMHDGLDKAEETAKGANDTARADKIKAERQAFDDGGDLPKSLLLASDFKQKLNKARKTLDEAYAAAAAAYATAMMDSKAEAVAGERRRFQGKYPTDAFKIGSVWKGKAVQVWTGNKPPPPAPSDYSLTVLERDDKTFRATVVNRNCTAEVHGAINSGSGALQWFAKDTKALQGQLPSAGDFGGKLSGNALELESKWIAFNKAPTVLTVQLEREKK